MRVGGVNLAYFQLWTVSRRLMTAINFSASYEAEFGTFQKNNMESFGLIIKSHFYIRHAEHWNWLTVDVLSSGFFRRIGFASRSQTVASSSE